MLEVMAEHFVTEALVGGVSLLGSLVPFSTERRPCFSCEDVKALAKPVRSFSPAALAPLK